MSDTKLDQSLDEILSTQRGNTGRRGGRVRRAATSARKSAIAPSGGVKKNVRGTKASAAVIPTGPSGGIGDSRIQVSNLVSICSRPGDALMLKILQPKDVSENQIKVC